MYAISLGDFLSLDFCLPVKYNNECRLFFHLLLICISELKYC